MSNNWYNRTEIKQAGEKMAFLAEELLSIYTQDEMGRRKSISVISHEETRKRNQ